MEDALGHDQAAARYPLLVGASPPPSIPARAATTATGAPARSGGGDRTSNTSTMVAGGAALEPHRLDHVGSGGSTGPANARTAARAHAAEPGARGNGITHSGGVHQGLSDSAVACLRQYYADDYAAIKTLQRVGCHGKTAGQCRSAAQSMLDRRAEAKGGVAAPDQEEATQR